jgi:hypothetical protein
VAIGDGRTSRGRHRHSDDRVDRQAYHARRAGGDVAAPLGVPLTPTPS